MELKCQNCGGQLKFDESKVKVGGCGSEVWDKMYPVLGSLIPVVLDESV